MKRFALIGAAGYIAPRHMKAIKETGNELVAALDLRDSVGIMDSYFPDAHFFVEPERFDRHLDKLRRKGEPVDYLVVCSPNYLHDAHIRMGLRNGADVICEKPLVLNPWNAEALMELEQETGHKVNVILQLRLDPAIVALKEMMDKEDFINSQVDCQVEIEYITPRGRWYDVSWKSDESKSGGIATNIGIHLFDMLARMLGDVSTISITESTNRRTMIGAMGFKRGVASFLLSTDPYRKPSRRIIVNGKDITFGKDFTDLHTESYRRILAGEGFGIQDAMKGIEITHKIRNYESKPYPAEGSGL